MVQKSAESLSIGALSRATGTKAQTIRYYEQIGLMQAPGRSAGNQRLYGPDHLARLTFIRKSRELGFSLEMIREILRLSDTPEQSCAAVDEVARRHLTAVEDKIAALRRLQRELKRMVTECAHDRIADCRVIEALSR